VSRRAPSKCVWERVPIVERCPCARQRYSTAKASTSKRPIRDATTRVPEGTRSSRVRELETAASRFGGPRDGLLAQGRSGAQQRGFAVLPPWS
jgi:hypothetical protein